jgi:hypothetical protein
MKSSPTSMATPVLAWLSATFPSFVFSSFPFLALYSSNAGAFTFRPDVIARPFVVMAVANVLVLWALARVVPDLRFRSSLVSFVYLGFFSELVTATWNTGALLKRYPDWWLSIAHLVLTAAIVGWAYRQGPRPGGHRGLTLAAATLLIVNLGQIAWAMIGPADEAWKAAAGLISEGGLFSAPKGRARPTIVHILLDGLGSPEVLRDLYHLDANPWVSALTGRGFVLARGAHSNYVHTYSSLASMINGNYLTPLAGTVARRDDRRPLHYLIQHSGIIESLRAAGYEFTLIGSSYSTTDSHRLASRCVCPATGLSELETAVYRFSPLRPLALSWLTYEPFRRKVLGQFDALRSLGPTVGPRYVLAHIISPHPPFAFDADGRLPAGRLPLFGMQDGEEFPGTSDEYVAKYRAQTTFILGETLASIDAIIRDDPDAVIIVSGDHGPGAGLHHEDPGRTDLRERFGTVLAIRSPRSTLHVPDRLTLVNVYRFVLSAVLGANLPLLPDHMYFTRFSAPYEFVEVEVPYH